MSTFDELRDAAPTIAEFLEQRTAATGLCFLATTRADGWPRVSPLELSIAGGRLYVGSMPEAVKARDLQRDPRCCVITTLADKDDLAGEVKAFCRAEEVTGGDAWDRAREAFKEANGYDIGEPAEAGQPVGAHVFELDLASAAWQRVEGDTWRTTSWTAGEPVRERIRRGGTGRSEELVAVPGE
ncbi:MAG: pyridoxamine 5'-phosphate oxidase family protein [Acidimicrobiales bacterium]